MITALLTCEKRNHLKYSVTPILIFLLFCLSSTFYGQVQIYVSIVMHNEEPPGYPDFVNNQQAFWAHRAAVVDFAGMLKAKDVMFNYQSDWNFLRAISLYDTGTPDTNNKNVLRYIKEDMGFEVDPHAHETLYNYADVAYLIEACGVVPSHTAGGMIVEPPEQSILEQFWQPITGAQYPQAVWQAQILWGGGTAMHQNEESLWASGIWKPKDKYHFLEHSDLALLPNVGHYGSKWENLDKLIVLANDGKLDPNNIYTCTIFAGQSQLLQPGFISDFEQKIIQHKNFSFIQWKGLAEVIEIWKNQYNSRPNILKYLQNDANNLLINSSFESGSSGQPIGWKTFTPGPPGAVYSWDGTKSVSGIYSVKIQNSTSGIGMWQQTINVVAGMVYELTGFVSFENIVPPGNCRLQAVFRDSANKIIQFVDLPRHDGTRVFEFDYPARLKFRAPANAVKAEINCLLQGQGKAWFDDIFFGPAPAGSISGHVNDGCGNPIGGVNVYLHGKPWGADYNDITDVNGFYHISNVPVTFDRYIAIAEKNGLRTRAAGAIAVAEKQTTQVDFNLRAGSNPVDNLNVKFGSLELNLASDPCIVPTDALIPSDSNGYPPEVREYLESDEYIKSSDPQIILLAQQIFETVPEPNRQNTYEVAWAVYEWIVRRINHDEVFGDVSSPYRDVTSGIYQTIQAGGWAWGCSFYDWAYKGMELVKSGCGICVEHSWLSCALLRALNIPARAIVGSAQFWVQKNNQYGYWVGLSTNGGSNVYREHGFLGSGFGFMPTPSFFSVTSEPLLHEDWNMADKGLWNERHPWGVTYTSDSAGLAEALADMNDFTETGIAGPGMSVSPAEDRYQIHYSDITINLYNSGFQRIIDVRFPIVMDSAGHRDMNRFAYWTNHPECIKRAYIDTITNPPTEGIQRWFHIEFDIISLLRLSDIDGNGNIDMSDLEALVLNWLGPDGCVIGDLDGDSDVDFIDIAYFANDY